MTSFGMIFHETMHHAISQGRKPVACRLGPDFREAYQHHVEWGASNGQYRPIDVMEFSDDNMPAFSGLQMSKMDLLGLALITVPQPESGFDLP